MTGGIPPGIELPCAAEATYKALYQRVLAQNKRYYERFPSDVQLVQRIVKYLGEQPGGGVELPTGESGNQTRASHAVTVQLHLHPHIVTIIVTIARPFNGGAST